MSTAAHLLTAEELFQLPEEQTRCCELIEGEIVRMSPPGFAHAIVSQRISLLLLEFVERKQIGQVVVAEAGFLIGRNPDTVMAPDGAFIRQDRINAIGLITAYFPEAPAMVFETISPTDRVSEVGRKMRRWLEGGVELAWVIDPVARTITVYQAVDDIQVLAEKDSLTGGDVLPGFECRVAELFAGL
jgi:Uma2 family endonuclease